MTATLPQHVDYQPLLADPSAEELARLRTALGAGEFGRASRDRYAKKSRVGIAMAAMVGGFLGLIFGIMALVALFKGNTEDAMIGLWFTAGVAAIGLVCGWLADRSERRGFAAIWRLVGFARANGLHVEPEVKVTLLPGSIFTTKRHATTSEKVSWTAGGHAVQAAVHHRASGGPQARSFTSRYLAVQLGAVPRLAFVTAGRRGAARPVAIAGPETTLTGDRGGRGKLTSLAATTPAARAFLTEELAGLLTDPGHPCHAEAKDGWFFAYYPANQKADEAYWRHAFALADAVARAHEQSSTHNTP